MARLIRTEKEVEGRYEEVWLVVEEDALQQWPAGAREIVGRPATRTDGLERARGEAIFTADLRLNGMLHTAVLRSPHAAASVARIDLAPALALPGVHAAIGPGEIPQLVDDCNYQGAAVAAVCADTFAQARAAVAAIDVEWDVREPLLDPDEAVRARVVRRRRAARARARRLRARPRRGRRRRLGRVPHRRSSCTARWRRTRRSCSGSATRSRCTSRRSTSGASATRSRAASGCRPTRCA